MVGGLKMGRKVGNPYKHHYRYGKQTTTIDFPTFQNIMKKGEFVKGNTHRSFLAFLYWFGVRKSEALERTKSDFKVTDNFLVVKCPAKKRGRRKLLKAPLDLPYVDLILEQVQKTRKTKANPNRRVWNFSAPTAWRIVKRVLPKHYPHFFRLNRAVHFLDDPTTTIPEMQAWFGWTQVKTINSYLGYSERHLDKQANRLRHEVKG
jgi:site-specific recombinase XerD